MHCTTRENDECKQSGPSDLRSGSRLASGPSAPGIEVFTAETTTGAEEIEKDEAFNAPRLTHESMLEAFRNLRDQRREQTETEWVIDRLLKNTGPRSLAHDLTRDNDEEI